jgi:hypothetical protein
VLFIFHACRWLAESWIGTEIRESDNLLAAGSIWLFSTDERTGMREERISELVKNLSEEMVKAGEAREPFQF